MTDDREETEDAMIAQLGEVMKKKLRLNAYKGSWYYEDMSRLLKYLLTEVGELAELIADESTSQRYEEIEAEAADVANFAGMILTIASERRCGR